MTEFTEHKQDGLTALFVNSETPPNRVERFDTFDCRRNYNKLEVFQLCRLYYNMTINGFTIEHSLLSWEPVEPKHLAESAIESVISAAKGVKFMIKEEN